ncbi:MAG: EAL domain-containing protein [Gammaproteobacteria bacterium]|nr:EAL domain-containing protein [Gammaproteobacteria bacterium]
MKRLNSNHILIFTAAISICILTWLILSISSSSEKHLVSTQVIAQNTQIKRQLIAKMNSAARERTLIILRMFHEQDVFVRDEMLTDIMHQGSIMNQLIASFRALHQTPEQAQALAFVIAKMSDTAPKIRHVSDLLINKKDNQAAIIVFTEILPNQDKIIELLNAFDNTLEDISTDATHILYPILNKNRSQIIWLTAAFIFFMLFIIYIVKTSFNRREAKLKTQGKELKDSNAINQSILNTAPDAIFSLNYLGVIGRVNIAALNLTLYKEADLLEKKISILALSTTSHETVLTPNQLFQFTKPTEVTFLNANKTRIPVSLTITDTGTYGPLKFTCILHDLRASKAAQLELTHQKLTMDKHSLVSMTDIHGTITYVNEKFCEVSGYSKDELIGQNHRVVNSDNQPEEYWHNMYRVTSKGGIWHDKVRNKAKDGHYYWVDTTILPLFDNEGKLTGYSSMRTDITVQKQLEEELRHQATHDALTKLANRTQYEERLFRYLQKLKNRSESGAVLFIDLDRFKPVNDSAGHAAGDLLLTNISSILSRNIRDRDTLARIGGDEFAVLLEDCPSFHAEIIAEQMRQEVDNFIFMHNNTAFNVSLSIGLVEVNSKTSSITTAVSAADNACQTAKQDGRNRIHIASTDSHELQKHVDTIAWLPQINKALTSNAFILYAQKISPFNSSSQPPHYEILIRLKDETAKIISPAVFIPPAERYDLMDKIDYWVIKKAFSLIKKGVCYSINLSGQTVSQDNLADYIKSLQKKYQINPQSITFEITETAAIQNLEKTRQFINELSQHGYQFSLDDFGSGLSSFGYLKNIPVNYLKIDGSIVKDINSDKISYAMVKSINEVGHSMGLKTIAEYVDSQQVLDLLDEIGLDYAQGFHIHKPEPLSELTL